MSAAYTEASLIDDECDSPHCSSYSSHISIYSGNVGIFSIITSKTNTKIFNISMYPWTNGYKILQTCEKFVQIRAKTYYSRISRKEKGLFSNGFICQRTTHISQIKRPHTTMQCIFHIGNDSNTSIKVTKRNIPIKFQRNVGGNGGTFHKLLECD